MSLNGRVQLNLEIMSSSLVPHIKSHFEIRIILITVLSCNLIGDEV